MSAGADRGGWRSASNRERLGVTPTLFTWTVWLCAGLLSLWPWTVSGRYTGSPLLRLAKRAGTWAGRHR
jgi:hypothetical protein